jgi:hypothetical protein
VGLATLLNLPRDQNLIGQFSFANQDSHRKIAAAVFAQMKGMIIPQYALDPIPLFQGGLLTWGLNHQATHNVQNEILGIQGEDLTSLDFQDEAQLSSWIQQHFIEHYQAEAKLGVT